MASGRPWHHLQALLRSRNSRRLTGAICLHCAGLLEEVSDGRLSLLRGGLIYGQMCLVGLLRLHFYKSEQGEGQPQAIPVLWGTFSPGGSGRSPLGGPG